MVENIFNVPTTYSGLLDDVVDRHRITPEIDQGFFNRTILRNIFFSGRIILNDGYLFSHPSALNQVLSEDSMLRVMIKNDFVKIIARKDDPENFASTPESNAERGMTSNQAVISRPDWPEIKKELHNWSSGLFHYGKIDSFPKHQMNEGFKKLFYRIFDKDKDDLGLDVSSQLSITELRDLLFDSDNYDQFPRTAIEDSLIQMRDKGRIGIKDVTEVMNIANQCYHYNFAMCLSDQRGEAVVADTTIGRAFEDILLLDDAVEAELGDIPILSIPEKFPIQNGLAFDKLLDPQSKLSRAKHHFLGQVDSLFATGNNSPISERKRELKEATEEYRRYLTEHFSDFIGLKELHPKKHQMITFGFGKTGSAFGAENVMLAANLVNNAGISSFAHRLLKPLRHRVIDVAINPATAQRDSLTFTAGEIKPRFASLAFDGKAVANHVSDLPLFEGS
jgi:hypothetical protein